MSAHYPNPAVPPCTIPPLSGNYINGPSIQQQQQRMQTSQPQTNMNNFMPPNKNIGANNQNNEPMSTHQQQSSQLFTPNMNNFMPQNKMPIQNIVPGVNTVSGGGQMHLPPQVRQHISNGGGGSSSANSSRTSSPALNNSFNNPQQNILTPPPIKPVQSAPIQNPINSNNLSGSIQNLSINDGPPKLNGNTTASNINPVSNQQNQQTMSKQPINYNFKTSALNTIQPGNVPPPTINQNIYQNSGLPQSQQPLLKQQSSPSQMPPRPGLQNGQQFPPITSAGNTPTINGPPMNRTNNMQPIPQPMPSAIGSPHVNNIPQQQSVQNANNIPQQQSAQNVNNITQQQGAQNVNNIPQQLSAQNANNILLQQSAQNANNISQQQSAQNANNISQQQPAVQQQNFKLNAIVNNNMPPTPSTQQPQVFAQQQPQPPPQQPPSLSAKKLMYPSQQTQTQAYLQAYQPSQQKPPPPVIQQQQQQQAQQKYQQPSVNGQQYQQQQQQQAAPAQQYQQQQQQTSPPQMSVTHQGFNHLWGQDTFDLMQHRHILSPTTIQTPKIMLNNQFHESVNVNPDIMRCTLNKIPENNSLLQKTRLPLGILIHPFRDINSLPVIQCPSIVRCRLCRTYINPFVYFVDSKMWKCNLCYRVNELPEDFQYDPATKTYGDVTRRPEVRSSTIEFIAPSEYMLRPPQPAIYLFLFDVSILAQQSGYLETACSIVSKHLDDMPGDARTQVGFVAYNSAIHFYNIAEGYNQPHEMTLLDIDDPFLPCPDNLLVNLKECKDLIKDLLSQLPQRFANSHDPGSCMGSALQVAYKLMMGSGGRVTVFQTCLPNTGAGALLPREDPNNRSAKDVAHLNPATDFYKRHALECSGYQIAVDLFVLNQQYIDLATISGVSKHCGGSVYHFPLYQKTRPHQVDSFKQCLKRYLTRKIGFEAVMRIRCTRGLQVHTFHGNFFVRSTDLLSLPNVNPDAGYGMQISYEENLADAKSVCFQAALLYTNSEGERRIRVHTLCLPVTANLSESLHSADAQAIVGLLSKMAVDRSLASNLSDAREAFINATIDILSAYKLAQNFPAGTTGQLMTPRNLTLLPLYILALLKHTAFRVGTSTRLDDRVAAMDAMKTLPLDQFMKYIYPEFYLIDCLFYNIPENIDEDDNLPEPPYLQLTAEFLDSRSMFLIDSGLLIIIYVGLNVPVKILESVLGVKTTSEIPDICYGLPSINTPENDALKGFINHLNEDKPYLPTIQIIRDTSTSKSTFIEKLVDDRSESSLSYYEFLQHLRTQVK